MQIHQIAITNFIKLLRIKIKFDKICRTYFLFSVKYSYSELNITIKIKGEGKMGCCHVKNQCLVIRLPKEIDHYQAEKVRRECEQSFMKFIIRDIIFDFSDTSFMDSSGIGWY